jgi:GNAT superfamily N-acetyltransferase
LLVWIADVLLLAGSCVCALFFRVRFAGRRGGAVRASLDRGKRRKVRLLFLFWFCLFLLFAAERLGLWLCVKTESSGDWRCVVVAVVVLFIVFCNDCCFVQVHPQLQGVGLGRRLVRKLEKHAKKKKGLKSVYLTTGTCERQRQKKVFVLKSVMV